MSTLNNEDRENLAAFLDGELDERAAHALEAKLNADPEAREEAAALRKAWSMLDYLPRPEPSPSFTNRTMERLTMALPRAAPTAKVPTAVPRRWLITLVWGVAVLFGVSLGAVAGSFLWQPAPVEDPVGDVIARQGTLLSRWTLLEPVIDLDYLKSLDQTDLFGEDSVDRERGRPGKPATLTPAQQRRLAATFLALPAERREQLIRLDRDLEASPQRDRLLSVAQRYRDWLDALQPDERERVLGETERDRRWTLVKTLRDQQWLAHQPKAHRELVESLQGQARADMLKKLRSEQARIERDWRQAVRIRDVARLEDLPRDLKDYYDEYLVHMLTREDKDRLAHAEGQWPGFMQTLVELADRHPPALCGPVGPERYAELPRDVKDKLKEKLKAGKAGKAIKDKDVLPWPLLAVEVSNHLVAQKKKVILANELWPTKFECLSPPMQQFVQTKLNLVLDNKELTELKEAQHRWPDYPKTIQKLAAAHHLQPPWFTLPAPRERWDIYRVPKIENADGPRP